MDKKKLTRLMIDSVVKRGIENMADDPRRSIRKLADLGRQFSTGRFQDDIIDIIQTILSNEDSPYYTMLQNFLDNTDHSCIRRFGINMGYNSWTYDARILRQKSQDLSITLPWALMFKYDARLDIGADPAKIESMIEQALPYGINSFAIVQRGGSIASNEIIDIFRKNEECAFFYFLENAELTASQASALKECMNVMISISADEPQSFNTSKLLHDAKLLYSIHHFYDDNDFEKVDSIDANSDALQKYFDYQSSMVILIPKKGCANHGDIVKQIRLEGKFPCFIWDMYYDSSLISHRLLGDERGYLEFETDGSIVFPSNDNDALSIDSPFIDIVKNVMPAYSCTVA